MNRRIEKVISMIISAVLLLSVCSMGAYAAEKLTVNGKEVKAGDTVTYEYYVGGIDDAVAAAGAFITYEPDFLKYVDGSIGFDVFNNAMFSVNDDNGVIYYAAVNSINGYDLKEKGLAVSLSFEVLSTAKGSTTIEHKFDEFFTIKDESTDIDEDEYEDENKLIINSYDGTNSSPYLGVDANHVDSYIENNSSTTVSDILNGNPNSNVSVASNNKANSSSSTANSKSTSENTSSNTATNMSGSSLSSNASFAESGASSTADSLSSVVDGVVSETVSVGSSQIASLNSDSETNDSNDGAAVVAIVCVVFVVLCAGAVLYFTNRKKNL